MAQLYPFTDPVVAACRAPTTMVSGRGCYVTDREGREYLDAVAGLWCASLGFSDERLISAAERQLRALPYYHSFMGRTADTTDRLARRLTEILPGGFGHVLFANSGSEAVDTAVKLTWFFQNARGLRDKKLVIARDGAYHGSGIASGGLTGMAYCHEEFDLPRDFVRRTGRPHYTADAWEGESERQFSCRRADELDELIREIGADRVGAFIGEPVIGSGGVIPPPDGYWQEIQAVLDRHDVLLIADEVITGFGRTGSWFGCQTFDMKPDLIVMAKQLSGAYFPISAVGIADHIHDTVAERAHELGTFGHGFTYGGHPVGAAIALEAIQIYEDMDVVDVVGRRSERLREQLQRVGDLVEVAEIRLVGLMAGVEIGNGVEEPSTLARHIVEEAEGRGVLFRLIGSTIAISPPLIVSDHEIDHLVDVLVASIRATRGSTS
jgi:adenosylmethionine-8-amino-7-oxononanoate aminotransferase